MSIRKNYELTCILHQNSAKSSKSAIGNLLLLNCHLWLPLAT